MVPLAGHAEEEHDVEPVELVLGEEDLVVHLSHVVGEVGGVVHLNIIRGRRGV